MDGGGVGNMRCGCACQDINDMRSWNGWVGVGNMRCGCAPCQEVNERISIYLVLVGGRRLLWRWWWGLSSCHGLWLVRVRTATDGGACGCGCVGTGVG